MRSFVRGDFGDGYPYQPIRALTSEHRAGCPIAACARRCGAPAGRFSGSGCGRRWRRLRPSSVFSSRCPGSGSGSGCRRLAVPPAWSCSRSWRSRRSIPFVRLRIPAAADALSRLDRRSGLRHRPATTIADELVVTPQGPLLARAVERACRAHACRGARVQGGLAVAAYRGARSLRVARSRPHRLSSPPSSPPAANTGNASPRRSTGRAWCCRRISASTPGSRRPATPASRRSFLPASIPARRRGR